MADPLDVLTDLAHGGAPPRPGFAAAVRDRLAAIDRRAARRRAPGPARWHLAQLNLGRFRAPLDSPEMAPFAGALDRINAIADASPGFVWRLTDDDGRPSSYVEVPGVDDPMVASNLSVWTDAESLRAFMYRTDHAAYLRRRAEWFAHVDEAMTVGWWIPAGTLPTLAEGVERLEHLRRHGPTPRAFTLGRPSPPPG